MSEDLRYSLIGLVLLCLMGSCTYGLIHGDNKQRDADRPFVSTPEKVSEAPDGATLWKVTVNRGDLRGSFEVYFSRSGSAFPDLACTPGYKSCPDVRGAGR